MMLNSVLPWLLALDCPGLTSTSDSDSDDDDDDDDDDGDSDGSDDDGDGDGDGDGAHHAADSFFSGDTLACYEAVLATFAADGGGWDRSRRWRVPVPTAMAAARGEGPAAVAGGRDGVRLRHIVIDRRFNRLVGSEARQLVVIPDSARDSARW